MWSNCQIFSRKDVHGQNPFSFKDRYIFELIVEDLIINVLGEDAIIPLHLAQDFWAVQVMIVTKANNMKKDRLTSARVSCKRSTIYFVM